jgi:hypothetical protein
MKRFKTFIEEGSYPRWVKVVTMGLVLRIRNLGKQIEKETDPKVQNQLISKQNTLISVLDGLSIGIDTTNPQIMNRLKSLSTNFSKN